MIRKIKEKISPKTLEDDLEKYRQLAIELGATDARIINVDMIKIEERVRAKCIWPKCLFYGTNAHCPPNGPGVEEVRKIVYGYRYGIFVKLSMPPEDVVGQKAIENKLVFRHYKNMFEIISRTESAAFYDGYYLALGFASGCCKSVFCPDVSCNAIIPGQRCRAPFKSRPSLESAGINAFALATKVGWDIYPIGRALEPKDVTCATALGLVLIY
jgi:predicted metal-binding protein